MVSRLPRLWPSIPAGSCLAHVVSRGFSISSSVAQSQRVVSPHASKKPINIVLLGAPGVGKGTYAKKIGPFFGIPHISTGDLVREVSKRSTNGSSADLMEALSHGDLVKDDRITQLLKERLATGDAASGVLLDGYPRNPEQVQLLDEILEVSGALHIHMREDVLVRKLAARRICPCCGDNYNIADIIEPGLNMPAIKPKKEGICDSCQTPLVTREDDQESVIRHRLELYKRITEPVKQVYEQRGQLVNFELTSGVADMWPKLRVVCEQSWPRPQ